MKNSTLKLAMALTLAACGNKEKTPENILTGESVSVEVQNISRVSVTVPINTSGIFTTDDETYLSFKTGGILQSIFVKEGDEVRKGQLLATLDLSEIQAGVRQAELGLEKAQRDFDRIQNLYKDSVCTREQFQNTKTGLDIANEQLKQVLVNRKYSEIRAVNNGYILKKFANPGQVVAPGTPILQTNGGIEQKWILKAALSDFDWAQVEVGNAATITCESMYNQPIKAKVIRKAESADPFSGTYFVDLEPEFTDNKKPAQGMFARAEILSSIVDTNYQIPLEYVFDAHGNQAFVFVTKDEKTARKLPVVLGKINAKSVEIIKGLTSEMKIITSGSAYLKDLSPIKIVNKP